MSLVTLESAIAREVINRHTEVLALVDQLLLTPCSYAAHRNIYVEIKLHLRRLERQQHYIVENESWPEAIWYDKLCESNKRIMAAEDLRDELHKRMYTAPCYYCTTCEGRVKAWPRE